MTEDIFDRSLSKDHEKILIFICTETKKGIPLEIRKISRKTGLPYSTARKYIGDLLANNLIRKVRIRTGSGPSQRRYIVANNSGYEKLKKKDEIRKMYGSLISA